jgi:hypothetical protein
MNKKKSRDIWGVAEEYHNLLSEYLNDSTMYLYLKLISTELIEIIYQLESLSNLTGYKINRLSNYKKTRYVIVRSIKEIIYSFKFKRSSYKTKLNDLVFFIEYENHYKQYLGLKSLLDNQSADHVVIFMNVKMWLKYKESINSSFYIGELYTNIDLMKSILKLFYVNTKLILNTKILNISPDNRSSIKLELLFFNSKFLLENYKISYAVNKVVKSKVKRAVFFKAEGFKIRNIIDKCSKNNIDTVAIQHGLIVENIKFNKLNINKYFVWSDVFAIKLNACNASCKTVSLGCPDYDKHILLRVKPELIKQEDTTRLLFLPNSGKSQTPESEITLALKTCLKYIDNNKDFELIIKPHPGGDSEFIKALVKSFDISNVIILEKEHKLDYHAYDIVVTMNSTVGIEAAIFRKPLIVILSSKEMMMINDYLNYKIAEFVTSDIEMNEAVVKIKTDYKMYQERCDIFINEYLTNLGTAAKKIVQNLLINV